MADIISKIFSKNNWLSKLKRTITGILPVDKNRKGQCRRCGACCKLPNSCLFLTINGQGLCECKIYHFRPLNCRKYPRTESEFLTAETCAYSFDETKD